MLKSISFVFKLRCVVSMLSPLSVKSYGESHVLGGGGQRDWGEGGVGCGNVPVKNNANNNYCFLFRKAKYA